MNLRHPRAAVFGIWGLIGLFLVMQAAIWMAAGGFPRRPTVLAQVIGAWLVMVVLAALASARIEWLSRNLVRTEQDHRAAVSEVTQLQIRTDVVVDPKKHFVVRASGDSMNGGDTRKPLTNFGFA